MKKAAPLFSLAGVNTDVIGQYLFIIGYYDLINLLTVNDFMLPESMLYE